MIGGDVFHIRIVLYNTEQFSNGQDVNMSIEGEINCLRIVFLNWYVTSMLVRIFFILLFTNLQSFKAFQLSIRANILYYSGSEKWHVIGVCI